MQQTYHGDEDGEGSKDLGPEPVGGLDVLLPLENRVVHKELLTGIFVLAVANVALDPLLKLRPGPLLHSTHVTRMSILYIHKFTHCSRGIMCMHVS